MIKLSIIIPYYNTKKYTNELIAVLAPQRNKNVEIIVVDDGSSECFFCEFDGIKTIRKKNGGVSSARNRGLREAKGEYIAFIDSDDLVSEDYIKQIFEAMETDPDTIYLSWKSMNSQWGKTLSSDDDEFGKYNRCVWNRVFKRSYIDGLFFDENMQIAEDDDFLNRLPVPKSKKCIKNVVYYYRQNRKGGLTYRKANGEFEEPDIKTQVVLYYSWIQQIGGVETFFYNFCDKLAKYYDICAIYDRYDVKQIARLQRKVQCVKNGNYKIQCDTLIMNGVFDKIPPKVFAKNTIRLVHTCKIEKYGILNVPNDCDRKIFVSKAAMESFSDDGDVIPNLPGDVDNEKAMILVSATRLTSEKGYERMLKLAERFKKCEIPFVWLVFTAKNDKTFPDGFVKLPPTLNLQPYIEIADYIVQLSDVEAFCYTLQEALQHKKPVLTTPIDVLPEVGVINHENGYVLPFNIDDLSDMEIKQIYFNIPKCGEFDDKTDEIVKKWRKVLGKTKPTHSYIYDETQKTIICNVPLFRDVVLDKKFKKGDIQTTNNERAMNLVAQGYWSYI